MFFVYDIEDWRVLSAIQFTKCKDSDQEKKKQE